MRWGRAGGSVWIRAMDWRINRRVSPRNTAGEFLLRIRILKADTATTSMIRLR